MNNSNALRGKPEPCEVQILTRYLKTTNGGETLIKVEIMDNITLEKVLEFFENASYEEIMDVLNRTIIDGSHRPDSSYERNIE